MRRRTPPPYTIADHHALGQAVTRILDGDDTDTDPRITLSAELAATGIRANLRMEQPRWQWRRLRRDPHWTTATLQPDHALRLAVALDPAAATADPAALARALATVTGATSRPPYLPWAQIALGHALDRLDAEHRFTYSALPGHPVTVQLTGAACRVLAAALAARHPDPGAAR